MAVRTGWSILITMLAGCGSSVELPGPQPYPVKGTVVFQGKPAVGFHVAFFPVTEQSGPKFAPSALVDANGEFQLESYRLHDGAPVGDYAVTFTWPQELSSGDRDDAPLRVDRLRGRFSDPRRSQFKVTVHEGENTLEPFVLK